MDLVGRGPGDRMSQDDRVEVVAVPARSRFEAHLRGHHVSTLEYRYSGPAAVLTHTYAVGDDRHGCSAFGPLIDAALDTLRRSGYYAVALCPHVRAFLRERPHRCVGVDTRFLWPEAL